MALSKIRNDSLADTAVHGRRNLIINGAARVQQRGSSITASGQHGKVDRFILQTGGGTTTFDAGTVSSSDAPYDLGFRSTLKITNTTAGSNAATDYAGMSYRIEAQDVVHSGWDFTSSSSYITLSFWAKSSLAGDYQVGFRSSDGTVQANAHEFTLVADTWKKITFTVSGDTAITVNDDTGIGLNLFFWAYLGTNYTTSSFTFDAWTAHSGSDQGGDFPQNWKSTASATFEVTGIQLEVGDKATPFDHPRSYGEELALCQRYYVEGGIIFQTGTPNRYMTNIALPVEMRVKPTISNGGVDSGSGGGVVPQISRDGANTSRINFYQGSNHSAISSAWIKFDAEL